MKKLGTNLLLVRSIPLACALALSACGGGGGGGSSGSTAGFVAPATPTATATATTPAAPVVAAAPVGSEELAAFNLLNAERVKCGFGSLVRNAQIDAAAKGHANWQLVNNNTGHFQVAGTPGFTGVSGGDRLTAAGYPWLQWLDENSSLYGTSLTTGYGVKGVRNLLSAPYHLAGLVRGFRDVGMSVLSSDDAGTTTKYSPRVILQIDLAYVASAGAQAHPAATVLSYPCDGTTGTAAQLSNESPNPIPARNLATSPIGQPVVLVGDLGKVLAVSSAMYQEKVTGNTVALIAPLTQANDPNGELQSNEIVVMPNAPLKLNTAYIVTIVGTNNGTSFTKTFTFNTGATLDALSTGS